MSDAALQKTLDYACGAGADCNPIHQNGACYNPNTIRNHCNYAVNSYFQKKGQAQGSCDFSGTASGTSSDPSEPLPSLFEKKIKKYFSGLFKFFFLLLGIHYTFSHFGGLHFTGSSGCVYPASARYALFTGFV